jgi:hypothetical protein
MPRTIAASIQLMLPDNALPITSSLVMALASEATCRS